MHSLIMFVILTVVVLGSLAAMAVVVGAAWLIGTVGLWIEGDPEQQEQKR